MVVAKCEVASSPEMKVISPTSQSGCSRIRALTAADSMSAAVRQLLSSVNIGTPVDPVSVSSARMMSRLSLDSFFGKALSALPLNFRLRGAKGVDLLRSAATPQAREDSIIRLRGVIPIGDNTLDDIRNA